MRFINILQTQPTDSLNVQEQLAAVAEKLSTTPISVIVSELADKVVNFGLKLLAALFIYTLGVWAIRKVKNILRRFFARRKTDETFASFTLSIVSIALTIILIIITIGAVGIDTTSIAALLAGGGMAIGLALNGTVQNFAGGMMIITFKPFKAGDYIEAQGYEGTVREVNIISTKLTTSDNRSIIIPNGALINGTVNNYSEQKYRRLEWKVSVEYGSSAEETKDILMALLKNDTRILTLADGAPGDPLVALSGLADSSVIFVMRGWVRSSDYWDVNFEINQKIYEELPKRGINFPFPQMDIHVRKD